MSQQNALDEQRKAAAAQRFADIWKQVRGLNESRRASEQDAGLRAQQLQQDADYRRQSLGLQGRQLDMIPAESALERASREKIAGLAYNPSLMMRDSRFGIEALRQQSDVDEYNRTADAIQSQANLQVSALKTKLAQDLANAERPTPGRVWGTNEKNPLVKQQLSEKAQLDFVTGLAAIQQNLAAFAPYVTYDPASKSYVANKRNAPGYGAGSRPSAVIETPVPATLPMPVQPSQPQDSSKPDWYNNLMESVNPEFIPSTITQPTTLMREPVPDYSPIPY